MSREAQQLVRLLRQFSPLLTRRGSPKFVLTLSAALVVYLVAAPVANRTLGLNLPGWRELLHHGSASSASRESATRSQTTTANTQTAPATVPTASTTPRSSDPRLAEIVAGKSRAAYESPAGLRYARGSQEGHRILHVLAHTRDEPDRPGSHGVFEVDEASQLVELIDEAYQLAIAGTRVQVEREGERVIYTVDMRRRVGYVGGQTGKRSNHPAAHKVRLVIDERNLITAFPVR
ncbi:MAG: hypothetical protein KDA61_11800 [Planctomycetales bacterium]|nr:hypothetical protein [Planctomycetales bacterium]